jgi:hypothetical protein
MDGLTESVLPAKVGKEFSGNNTTKGKDALLDSNGHQ